MDPQVPITNIYKPAVLPTPRDETDMAALPECYTRGITDTAGRRCRRRGARLRELKQKNSA